LPDNAGSDVAASATRVRTLCAVGWESPTSVSDLWRFLAVNRAPPGVAPDDGRGSFVDPEGSRKTQSPRAPAGRAGFSRTVAWHSKRLAHVARSGGVTRRSRRNPGCAKQLELRHIAPLLHPHRRAPSRTRGRGGCCFETPPSMKAFASSRDAPNFQANNPLFKERVPDLHVAYRSRGLSPTRPANVALHDASFASDHACSRGRRHVAPTPYANRLSSDAPSWIVSRRTA
jgi:hypothetical protein